MEQTASSDIPNWPEKALEARRQLLTCIPQEARIDVEHWTELHPKGSDVRRVASESGVLTARELELTSPDKDVTELALGIKDKRWTSQELTLAFGKRACVAHQMTTCLTDIFMEEALQRARELDEIYHSTGHLVGPLHGVPISAKEYYKMKGHVSTFGVADFLDLPAQDKNCSLVQILIDAGAVFFCRTNMPQTGMQLETNSFWGETTNPWNTALTPGGSSGGCGALVAFGGSPLSIAGDIGGSLRCPAANCGLWTIKCTTQRVPREGQTVRVMRGVDGISGTCGPITRSLRDLDLFMRVVLDAKPWLDEHLLVPLPWRPSTLQSRLRPIVIGMMSHDGAVIPQPPIQRAFEDTIEALKTDPRFHLVEFPPFDHQQGIDLIHEMYFPDGAKALFAALEKSGEPVLPLTRWVMTRPGVHEQHIKEYNELCARRDEYRAAYLKHWNSHNVDAVLCPTMYGSAPPLGTTRNWEYTCIFNLLDYPAISFPTGLLGDSTRDLAAPHRPFLSEEDRRITESYDPEFVTNAPLSLQLVGRRFEDEELVYIMSEISNSILPLDN